MLYLFREQKTVLPSYHSLLEQVGNTVFLKRNLKCWKFQLKSFLQTLLYLYDSKFKKFFREPPYIVLSIILVRKVLVVYFFQSFPRSLKYKITSLFVMPSVFHNTSSISRSVGLNFTIFPNPLFRDSFRNERGFIILFFYLPLLPFFH